MKDSLFFKITLSVLLVHVMGISWSIFFSSPITFTKAKEKVIVRTVALSHPPEKVPEKKIAASPKPVATKKPVVKTEKEKILEKAKENIAKLQQTRDNLRSSKNKEAVNLQEVAFVDSLSVDSQELRSDEEASYYASLSSALRAALRLPEMGSVKIELTLDRQGNVRGVKSVASESDYNKKFVEAMVPKIKYPPFGKSFKGQNTHQFLITLTNDN